MTQAKPRNSSLSAQVLKRDKRICQCCGWYEADEVHHIQPVVFGGLATLENLITLCSECHRFAPNKAEDFLEYQKSGGARWQRWAGIILSKDIEEMKADNVSIDEFWNMLVDIRLSLFQESYRLNKNL